ncbi:hypothetical protein OESDEN_08063 [Oesophagostomum dentatum]|uniref:7TM GPCR serpentine receptor class x (Srx) domain-containing protein n=1 Tax=Oesophagostomum dentatum TaxID=61180 RepID=A0A0B1T8D9_OESDE|nr:hypothetical protein OESDEN_08063 [Oesophagostomum dentatum]
MPLGHPYMFLSPAYQRTEKIIHPQAIVDYANIVQLQVSLLGLLFNGAAMVTVRFNPTLRSSFGILCFSQCVASFGLLLAFLLWATPITLLGNPAQLYYLKLPGKLVGQRYKKKDSLRGDSDVGDRARFRWPDI